MAGLKNRFNPNKLIDCWAFHYKCLWCGKSGADCFHHIISPSSQEFKAGDFNNSVLNSCPIHNDGCHIYNPALHQIKNEEALLQKVLCILLANGYALVKKDYEFIGNYKHLYQGA